MLKIECIKIVFQKILLSVLIEHWLYSKRNLYSVQDCIFKFWFVSIPKTYDDVTVTVIVLKRPLATTWKEYDDQKLSLVHVYLQDICLFTRIIVFDIPMNVVAMWHVACDMSFKALIVT